MVGNCDFESLVVDSYLGKVLAQEEVIMAGVNYTSVFLGFEDGGFKGEDLTTSPVRLLLVL